jgi:hypothetical protein
MAAKKAMAIAAVAMPPLTAEEAFFEDLLVWKKAYHSPFIKKPIRGNKGIHLSIFIYSRKI